MKKLIYILSSILLVHNFALTQSSGFGGEYSPPSPNVAELGKYIDIPVNRSTGVPNISIPIHTINDGTVNLPISLSYHGSGIKTAMPSSWVGAGWSMNAGGIITRTIEGIADDKMHDGWYYSSSTNFELWNIGEPYNSVGSNRYISQSSIPIDIKNQLLKLKGKSLDNGPDIFTYQLPSGYSGKFHFDINREIRFVDNHDNLKIEVICHSQNKKFISFEVTDPEGNRYTFGTKDAVEYHTNGSSIPSMGTIKAWYLVKIENVNNTNSISLEYEDDKYMFEVPAVNASTRTFGSIIKANEPASSCFFGSSNINFLKNLATQSSATDTAFYSKKFQEFKQKMMAVQQTISMVTGGTSNFQAQLYGLALQSYYLAANTQNTSITKNVVYVAGKRLSKISSSISNEIIYFNALTEREDLLDYHGSHSKRLDEIKITKNDTAGNQASCKEIKFNYDYFVASSSYDGKRLKLNSIQESSCNSIEVIPPYQFKYKGQFILGNQYFPSRFTKAVDHWGYFNGEYGNNSLPGILIPSEYVLDQQGDTVLLDGNHNVRRESSEIDMLLGTLDTIIHPTGGKTIFEFEANKAPRKVDHVENRYLSIADDLDDGVCGDGISVQDYGFSSYQYYASGGSIIDFSIEKKMECAGISNQPVTGILEVIDQNGNTIMSPLSVSVNGNTRQYLYKNELLTSILDPLISDPTKVIRFKITVLGSGIARLHIRKEYTTNNLQAAVGGLRIKKITYDDGINPMTTEYDYTIPGPTSSVLFGSGLLLKQPIYGRAYRKYDAISNEYVVSKLESIASPHYPLGNLQGMEIIYSKVTEKSPDGSYTEYFYNVGDTSTINTPLTFPLKKEQHSWSRGLLDSVKMFHANNNLVQKKEYSYIYNETTMGYSLSKMPFSYENAFGSMHRIECSTLGSMQPHTDLMFIAPYDIKSGYSKLSKQVTTTYNEQGLEPITDIISNTYDSLYNLSTSITWRETDGDKALNGEDNLLQEYYYLYDGVGYPPGGNQVKAFMENHNMVGIPFKSVLKYKSDNTTYQVIDGSHEEYTLINSNSLLVPYKTYKVEGGNFYPSTINTDWDNRGLVKKVHDYVVGNVISDTLRDDNYMSVSWIDDKVKSISLLSSLGHKTNTFSYWPTGLLHTVTDHHKKETFYKFDDLLRLKKISKGKAQTESSYRQFIDYEYNYKLSNTGIPISGNENEVVTTHSFASSSLGNVPSQVTRMIYDNLGRLTKEQKDNFTPNNGDAILKEYYYNSLGLLYQEKNLGLSSTNNNHEASPLKRISSVSGPKGLVNKSYGANTSPIIIGGKTYAVGSLSKKITIDEDGSKTTVYKDFIGKMLQMVKEVTINGTLSEVKTTYVYNKLNQLVEVIPPQGNSYKYTYNGRGWMTSKELPNQAGVNTYFYDHYGRVIAATNPNNQTLATSYDDLGRKIETGRLTSSLIMLDASNNLAKLPSSGIDIIHTKTKYRNPSGYTPFDWIEEKELLNMSTINTPSPQYLKMTFYQDAIGRVYKKETENHQGGMEVVIHAFNNADLITNTSINHNVGNSSFGQQIDLDWEYTFDHALRSIDKKLLVPGAVLPQKVVSRAYNNYGQLVEEKLHQVSGTNDYWQKNYFEYDQAGRLIKINDLTDVDQDNCATKSICDIHIKLDESYRISGSTSNETSISDLLFVHPTNGETSVATLAYPYTFSTTSGLQTLLENWLNNEGFTFEDVVVSPDRKLITITQTDATLTRVKQGNVYTDIVTANCCGQVHETALFAEKIIYPVSGSTINSVEWGSTCNGLSKYYFLYDELKRLQTATYYSVPNLNMGLWYASGEYNMTAAYDQLGNIKTLQRQGLVGNNVQQIDDLTYMYNSLGQLGAVLDGTGANHLNHGQKGNSGFIYDNNGNTISESAKGINISYDEYNMPYQIQKTSITGESVFNAYLAGSERVQKVLLTGSQQITTDYIGGFIYKTENGVTKLESYNTSFGRLRFKDNNDIAFEYSIKDHLGNIRINFTDRDNNDVITKTDVIQETHNYPFGLQMEGIGGPTIGIANNYKYNNKELDSELGLEWYNYGARFYNPALARWYCVDLLAEKYLNQSTYGFVGGNPVGNREIDGRYYVGSNGKKVKFKLLKNGTIKIGRNASSDLIRLVNAANSTGSKKILGIIMDVSRNKTKVNVKVVKEKVDNGRYGVHEVHDVDGNILNWNDEKEDFDGVPAYVEGEVGVYKEATITVFEGDIKEYGGSGKYYGYNDISIEQEIGRVFGHESNHDSDSEFIQDLRNKREGKSNNNVDSHDNIHDIDMFKEIHEYNNKKDD